MNQIPDAGPITLEQQGVAITDYEDVRADLPLLIGWPPFTIGASHPGTIWDDLIFVLISDAGGEIVFTGGAPNLASGFLDYTKTSVEAPAGIMQPGTEYVVFISQVKYVDNNVSEGIEQVACNSFAVELPVRTAGAARPFTGRRRKAPTSGAARHPPIRAWFPGPPFSGTDSSYQFHGTGDAVTLATAIDRQTFAIRRVVTKSNESWVLSPVALTPIVANPVVLVVFRFPGTAPHPQ